MTFSPRKSKRKQRKEKARKTLPIFTTTSSKTHTPHDHTHAHAKQTGERGENNSKVRESKSKQARGEPEQSCLYWCFAAKRNEMETNNQN